MLDGVDGKRSCGLYRCQLNHAGNGVAADVPRSTPTPPMEEFPPFRFEEAVVALFNSSKNLAP